MKFPRNISCTSKKQFRTFKAAENNLKGLLKIERDKSLHIYTCNYCHFFHIGHQIIKRKGVKAYVST